MPPLTQVEASKLVRRRHPEWAATELTCRWLQDSLEGGDRYRDAVYGYDKLGKPVHNLVRHAFEVPPARSAYSATIGEHPSLSATVDDFELRRARTPPPTLFPDAIEKHLAKIYRQEVRRDIPEVLAGFLANVDGQDTPLDEWMRSRFAPLFLALGCLDVIVDRPVWTEEVRTRADELRLDNTPILVIVPPQDVVWWRLLPSGLYEEVLIRERILDQDDKYQEQFRHWTTQDWTLYDDRGVLIETAVHPYGVVPVIRLFEKRSVIYQHAGRSRYLPIAFLQQEAYNRDSELVLSDTIQAHPQLQAPDTAASDPDNPLPMGPGYILFMRQNPNTNDYVPFSYLDPPKGASDSLRANVANLVDRAERSAGLVRPAGAEQATVGQSGVSKVIDLEEGSNLLASIAASLARAETRICQLALRVLKGGPTVATTDQDAISIVYPKEFALWGARDLTDVTLGFQQVGRDAGNFPDVESGLMRRIVRSLLPGLPDEEYAEFDREIEQGIASRSIVRDQERESAIDGSPPSKTTDPEATDA